MVTTKMGPDGRVLVPVELRRKLRLHADEALVAWADEDRLVIERRAGVLRRVRQRFGSIPAGVSMVEELLEDRAREAAREAAAEPS